MTTATLPDVTTSTARQRSIAAKYIREYRRAGATPVRGAASLRAAAAGLANDVAALTLRGEHADAQQYAAAMRLVSDRATRIAAAAPITNVIIACANDGRDLWDEAEMHLYLERAGVRTIFREGAVATWDDDLGGEPFRELGHITYTPSTGSWTLERKRGWTTNDLFTATFVIKVLKAGRAPRQDEAWVERVDEDGGKYLLATIGRRLSDLHIDEVFKIDPPAPAPGSAASSVDPLDGTGCKIAQDDVDMMFDCHDEAQFEGKAEIASDPRPVEIFRCPKTNRIMRRIGVSRYDERTRRFLAVAFEGATGLDHARIWNAPGYGLDHILPLGDDALAATTIHTREDGTRYADVSIARPLDDCNAEELAGIAHDLFELITNPDATAEGEWGENRVFLEVTA